jgi:hypothetical protein
MEITCVKAGFKIISYNSWLRGWSSSIEVTCIAAIIIIIIISFMQGIYTYIPETNYVPREYSVADILLLLFMVHTSLAPVLNVLHFYISTFRSMCAVPNMAVFCSFLTSWIPGTLLRYFLNDFEMVQVTPIITSITFAFTFHMSSSSSLLLLLLTASGYVRGGSGTTIHKIAHTHTQNNTQCTQLQTQCIQNYKHNVST